MKQKPFYYDETHRNGKPESVSADESVIEIGSEIARAFEKEKNPTMKKLQEINRNVAGSHNRAPISIAHTLKAIRSNNISLSPAHVSILKKAKIRSLSGVTVITVLTKPYRCPGKCVYCPQEPGMPKSYISNEPGAQRAVAHHFHPFWQVVHRLQALWNNGHDPDKVELIVLGGTWSAYSPQYQNWFIKQCFHACNVFVPDKAVRKYDVHAKKSLEEIHSINENADVKIIGLTLETRPDCITKKEIAHMRKLGCTRVQLGVQSLDDDVLDIVQRGHTVEDTARASALLRSAGFKFDYHLMPNLPGSDPKKDLKTYETCFTDPRFIPDQIKIYPCIVNRFAPLYQLWKRGTWKPYTNKMLTKLLTNMYELTPRFVRINRLIRDIPESAIDAGNTVTNLRQLIEEQMEKDGTKPVDIRSREARETEYDPDTTEINITEYEAAGGTELFIEIRHKTNDTLYGFVRLRLPARDECWLPELKDESEASVALIRELHVYGHMKPARDGTNANGHQHVGVGKLLMKTAEEKAKTAGYKAIAVIAGVGVKNYYRKIGYSDAGTYVKKSL